MIESGGGKSEYGRNFFKTAEYEHHSQLDNFGSIRHSTFIQEKYLSGLPVYYGVW